MNSILLWISLLSIIGCVAIVIFFHFYTFWRDPLKGILRSCFALLAILLGNYFAPSYEKGAEVILDFRPQFYFRGLVTTGDQTLQSIVALICLTAIVLYTIAHLPSPRTR